MIMSDNQCFSIDLSKSIKSITNNPKLISSYETIVLIKFIDFMGDGYYKLTEDQVQKAIDAALCMEMLIW